MLTLLLSTPPEYTADYMEWLPKRLKSLGIEAELSTDLPPETVDYVVYGPNDRLTDFSQFPKLKAVFSLWAGVEKVVGNPTITVPLTRMVDPGLTEGMVEFVTGHVLRHHLGMDAHITATEPHWNQKAPPLARQRKVCMLGIGALGAACAQKIASFGFDVHGWSRSPKTIDGLTCHAGAAGLDAALRNADIVVTLLPNTADTENTLNARTLSLTAKGAVIINPGRGPLIDDKALLAALDSGQISHATLDVFRVEPLPASDPYWAHPKVTVTPHVAALTRPASASGVVAENIRRAEAGEALLNLVDRALGY
ncbi:Glyoxylate/hydroxypyruvate reductase A [Aquimixticola soesokkakensis]|uniref:Glyoxylate/hydroxypyruvate reductase A n=1 Tax=Aquimixticola soesokkakensis TaxID=1519096 RepID=A0A1Y5SAR3_9RHOB|nr:glyoxylate/hydroxypyruvate reductase A [Aquimixticola soesokkakensis]SLN33496.1 Glyoxylate/hydroxypyruvate reductase A [Aquimixticola soesokkakensis]